MPVDGEESAYKSRVTGGRDMGFLMRAFHPTTPRGYVYWVSEDELPDYAAVHAPFPATELTDIAVYRGFMPKVTEPA